MAAKIGHAPDAVEQPFEAGAIGAGEALDQRLGHPSREAGQIGVEGGVDIAAGERVVAVNLNIANAEQVHRHELNQ